MHFRYLFTYVRMCSGISLIRCNLLSNKYFELKILWGCYPCTLDRVPFKGSKELLNVYSTYVCTYIRSTY